MRRSRALWERRRADERAAANADQVELQALRLGSSPVDHGLHDELLADAMDEYSAEPADVDMWAQTDARRESGASEIALEIKRRSALLGPQYPFALSRGRLAYSGSDSLVYEFCLAITEAPSLTRGEYRKLPSAFERLCRALTQRFLGCEWGSYRTGWSAEGQEDRPSRFRDVAREIYQLTGEFVWCPESDFPEDPDPTDVKDLGLDYVVWRHFGDTRRGNFFVLVQCACGDDWEGKLRQLSTEKLKPWFRPSTQVEPIRAFAIPRHVPNIAHFHDVNAQAGVTMDRTRLVLMARNGPVELGVDLGDLVRLVIPSFQAA